MKNRDIIITGIQPWDIEIGSNCKNIALEMARQHRVLYINSPLDRLTARRKAKDEKIARRKAVIQGRRDGLEQISENLWVYTPDVLIESISKISPSWLFDWLNRRNNKLFARSIKKAIQRLDFNEFILFIDSDMFRSFYLKELLSPQKMIYYMRDYLTKNPYWKKNGVRIEPLLIKKADAVVNNSILYANYGRQYNAHSYMVGQGCDVGQFDDVDHEISVAEDLSAIKSPRIGYVGFLSGRRLNIDLLLGLAQSRPQWQIVLVGPEDENFKSSALHALPNVHFMGSRQPEELPGYIKGFDVCINPQRINDATRGNYPRKIDEYLAMGKPVVATSTEAMEYFKDYCGLGITWQDYVDLIQQAMEENNPEKAGRSRRYAQSHTWANNVAAIWAALEKATKSSDNE